MSGTEWDDNTANTAESGDPLDLSLALGDRRPMHEIASAEASAWSKMARRINEDEKAALGPAVKKHRMVKIERNPTPTVSGIAADSYHCIAQQLHQFRSSAHVDEWPAAKVQAFRGLVQALAQLQDIERSNIEALQLGKLSEPELRRLSEESEALLAKK